MLFYTYMDKDGDCFSGEWHIGEPIPEIPGSATIDMVQVDGHEREHICNIWGSRLPIPGKAVIIWPAPWAGLILLNL
jgi:hypothetical protein